MALKVEQIARICHDTNRSYCQSIGDNSQLPWDEAPDWQKVSAMNGVQFRLATPDATEFDMHDNWMKEKLADGWQYGEVKDVEKKTHPCLLPYEKLPEVQRFKDILFSGIVMSFVVFEEQLKNIEKLNESTN